METFLDDIRDVLRAQGFWAPEGVEDLKKATILALQSKEHIVICSKLQNSCLRRRNDC